MKRCPFTARRDDATQPRPSCPAHGDEHMECGTLSGDYSVVEIWRCAWHEGMATPDPARHDVRLNPRLLAAMRPTEICGYVTLPGAVGFEPVCPVHGARYMQRGAHVWQCAWHSGIER